MPRTIFAGGLVFDGSGSPSRRGHVAVRDDRIESVSFGDPPQPGAGDLVVDCAGSTVMPGLIDGHSHLSFPSALGSLEPRFNPPLDVSYFQHLPAPEEYRTSIERHAAMLLDAGFTSAYSAGSLLPGDDEARVRDRIDNGEIPGPRLRACSRERDNVIRGDHGPKDAGGETAAVTAFVEEMAQAGFDNVKLLLSNDDVFFPGGSQVTQYNDEETAAAAAAARRTGVNLNCHAQNPVSVQLAVRHGFRAIYHCSYADEPALDLLEAHRDELFVGPAVGIIWANCFEGEEFGIDREQAEKMGSFGSLEGMRRIYPELRRRGLRVVIGGDYGFPNNPIGRQARDIELFVTEFGYTPAEALRCATQFGGELMDMQVGLLEPGYLADLLVVGGDPTQDVRILQDRANLRAIMKGGSFHVRAAGLPVSTDPPRQAG
jgi:imidazolonepropionase-like amidohydrolase